MQGVLYKHTLDNWSRKIRPNCPHTHVTTTVKTLWHISLLSSSHTHLSSPLCLPVWVMLSSGAELSHCEQRGNQSLFTNQLSSVSGWREDTKTCPTCTRSYKTPAEMSSFITLPPPFFPFFISKSPAPQTQSHTQIIMSSLVCFLSPPPKFLEDECVYVCV